MLEALKNEIQEHKVELGALLARYHEVGPVLLRSQLLDGLAAHLETFPEGWVSESGTARLLRQCQALAVQTMRRAIRPVIWATWTWAPEASSRVMSRRTLRVSASGLKAAT